MASSSSAAYACRDPVTRAGEGTRSLESSEVRSSFRPQSCISPTGDRHSVIDLSSVVRVVLSVTPSGRGSFEEQAREVLSNIDAVLARQPHQMVATVQTVFLRDGERLRDCQRLLKEHFGSRLPVTNLVLQPPCCGAALGIEVWAIAGPAVTVERHGPHVLSVSHDGIHWMHCGGVTVPNSIQTAYRQTGYSLRRMRRLLEKAGSGFHEVVRAWLYQGGITSRVSGLERYHELNRARTEFYDQIQFGRGLLKHRSDTDVYPASTGIGTLGCGLVASCLALQTERRDVKLVPLENPNQIPSYCYGPEHSPQSPKFSRAMAVVLGDYAITWVSGTASIVKSESCHPADVEAQTEQTIDNIERLITKQNLERQGLAGADATLHNLAKVRVYLKRREDYDKCRAICEKRFGPVPAIYVVADICRPELLVEIEGMAVNSLTPAASNP